jgi:hypothetical protein
MIVCDPKQFVIQNKITTIAKTTAKQYKSLTKNI